MTFTPVRSPPRCARLSNVSIELVRAKFGDPPLQSPCMVLQRSEPEVLSQSNALKFPWQAHGRVAREQATVARCTRVVGEANLSVNRCRLTSGLRAAVDLREVARRSC